VASLCAVVAQADVRTQARRLHDRLAGVPPDAATLDRMAGRVAAGDAIGAARIAMQAPTFYSVTLRNWATPWTTRERSLFTPFNDYTATVIGMVRDDLPFDTVLSADILYVGGAGWPAYSPADNILYADMERRNADLSDPAVLVRATQSSANGLPAAATAGVMTTRAASEAFFAAGTNRAMLRFTLVNHLCEDLESLHDTALPPDRIRQDVSRSPGGDSRLFLNNCVGCHNGMDPLAQAFAHYDHDAATGRIRYTAAQVQPKYLINADNFRPGFVTPDDSWTNYWRKGRNRALGWSTALPGAGNGAKSLGQELAASQRFARCQVEKAFRTTCLREPADSADRLAVDSITAQFRAGGHRMKDVFASTAVHCMGE
jgi:hypothetical protein